MLCLAMFTSSEMNMNSSFGSAYNQLASICKSVSNHCKIKQHIHKHNELWTIHTKQQSSSQTKPRKSTQMVEYNMNV